MVVPAPTACACCGGQRLSKLGEEVTETLEVVPRQWKVIASLRERFSASAAATASNLPSARALQGHPGWSGPHLLNVIPFEKFGLHQPLTRHAEALRS